MMVGFIKKVEALKVRLKDDGGNIGLVEVPGVKGAFPWAQAYPKLKEWSEPKLDRVEEEIKRQLGDKVRFKREWFYKALGSKKIKIWPDPSNPPKELDNIDWGLRASITVTRRRGKIQTKVLTCWFNVYDLRGTVYYRPAIEGDEYFNAYRTIKEAVTHFKLAILYWKNQ